MGLLADWGLWKVQSRGSAVINKDTDITKLYWWRVLPESWLWTFTESTSWVGSFKFGVVDINIPDGEQLFEEATTPILKHTDPSGPSKYPHTQGGSCNISAIRVLSKTRITWFSISNNLLRVIIYDGWNPEFKIAFCPVWMEIFNVEFS